MYKLMGLAFIVIISFSCCEQRHVEPTKKHDLTTLKSQFLQRICGESYIEEGPFSFGYKFRTVFYSNNVISLFGELTVHDRLPHGWQRYESKTLYKDTFEDQWKEVTLNDFFHTEDQKEFLRMRCEAELKTNPASHFSGIDPLYTTLKWENIHIFVLDDVYLTIVFQSHSVASSSDGPIEVRIPISEINGQWNKTHPFHTVFSEAIESNAYISSWDEKEFYTPQ